MTTLSSPGTQVKEFDLTPGIEPPTSTPGAFSGVFQWGPVDQVVLVDSEDILRSKFFKPTSFNAETWMSCASYLAYTDSLNLTRAADTTGNTVEKIFSGNATSLAGAAGNNVLQLSNTTDLAVGQVLAFSNAVGAPVGAIISQVNSTAVVLNNSFAANVDSIDVLFRDNVTFTAAALQSDLNYDMSDVSDWDSLVVKNEDDYTGRTGSFDSAALYVARCPGEPGNSLRVSVCDSADQFSSDIIIAANTSTLNATASVLTGTVGSNTITVAVVPANTANATHVTAANAQAGVINDALSVGDLVEVGNSTIGLQILKITSLSGVSMASNVFTVTFTTDDEVKLSGNVENLTVSRFWEFYPRFDSAPGQSPYVLAFGNTAAMDEVHAVVVDEGGAFSDSPGTVLEVYNNMSRATDAKSNDGATIYYKNVLNAKSKYIWWANDRTTARSATAAFVASSTATKPLSMRMVGGASGLGEADVSIGTLAFGWDHFASSEDTDVGLLFQGKARGESVTNHTQLANYITDNVVNKRNPKDCVLFVSPDIDDVVNNKGEEANDVVAFASNLRDSSYVVCDSGYKWMYDKYNDVNRWVPLNADIAGLCARTDRTNDPWWSPAGLTRGQISNVIRLAWNPRQAERDTLYKSAVNPVISEKGLGTYLNGDKTSLDHQSAFDRINVRRLFITLEKAITKASKFVLYEFNDDFTRAQFRNAVTPYLRDVKGRRGIYDFRVICDSSNNTPEVIDRNELIMTILIKPARSINFITLNFVATRTGVSFETVTGFGG